jgi:outer membrane protein assembly factor BamB
MSHSSIVPVKVAGKKMYVYCAVGGVVGVSAEPGNAGAVLWQLPWNAKVVAPSPVPLEDGKIFITAGYGEGGMTINVQENGGTFSAEILEKHGPKDGLACEQQTPIYHDGLLYAIMPKDGGALRGQFVCYRPGGSLVWSSGQSHRFGLGPFLLAGGKFYVLNDDGMLTMIKASREAYLPLDQAQVLHGQDAWGPIALAGDRMLLRDSKQMVCVAVGARNP